MAMDPVTMSAVGSVVSSIASGFFGGGNRSWQQMMSNTAHQREVKDLRAAGLNPILSAMGGNGASTPSGASIDVQNLGADVSSAYANKVAKQQADIAEKRTSQDIRESDSRIANNVANLAKTEEETKNLILSQQATALGMQRTAAETANLKQTLEALKNHPELVLAQIRAGDAAAAAAYASSAVSQKNLDLIQGQIRKVIAEAEGVEWDNEEKRVKGKGWKVLDDSIEDAKKTYSESRLDPDYQKTRSD